MLGIVARVELVPSVPGQIHSYSTAVDFCIIPSREDRVSKHLPVISSKEFHNGHRGCSLLGNALAFGIDGCLIDPPH